MNLDEKDLEILRILQRNCKLSTRELASQLNCPITTVYSKIRRMEKSGLIKSYKAILNAKHLKRGTTAFILASVAYVNPQSSKIISQHVVANEVSKFSEVQEVHIISGNWDLLIKVKNENVESVGDFVVDKLRRIVGIEKTLTCMAFDTLKEDSEISI